MQRESNQSDRPDTLPPAELNPTLNPVLGQNMGRWAEVYFKSPPEKRDAAVLELLHTLEAENAPGANAQVDSADSSPTFKRFPSAGGAAAPQAAIVHCPVCDDQNPSDQRFCGTCGARLDADAPAAEFPGEERIAVSPDSSVQNWHSTFLPRDAHDDLYSRSDLLTGSYEDGSSSRPYRFYVGTALAIIMIALGYMAWRSAQATGNSRLSPKAPPSVASSEAPPPSTPTTQATAPGAQTNVPSDQNTNAPALEPAERNASPKVEEQRATPAAMIAKDQPRKDQPEPRRAQTTQKPAQDLAASGSGGAEELAMAQRYLGGNSGQQRDTAEAVNWLWKAVAKKNLQATLQLSDLFLKGDGIPKNCDQARVLLQAAATKGNSGAAERLRHMQAFGCQ